MRQLRERAGRWESSQACDMFKRLAGARMRGRNSQEYKCVRSEVVLAHANLVRTLASKYANRGEPLDDLIQVGMLALIKAIDRFDVGRGVTFATYAVPTIEGEIKRYFRDKSWTLKVPRRLKELNLSIGRAVEVLTVELGRSPTSADIANYLRAREEEVIEAQDSQRAYRAMSLDGFMTSEQHTERTLEQYIGTADMRLARYEDVVNLTEAFETLNRQERRIVYWRFYDSLPQAEIARRLNVSQMHVSRMQCKALQKMRKVLTQ